MSEKLPPCPFCGADGDQWSRRTPGPATKAMLAWCKKAQDPAIYKMPNPSNIMIAFLNEWKEAGT